ncbi:MAG: extracellular solute-binding protein, partial [Bacillota bacterium]|nr:extracellular solute-binding protein [Bacillota bacterium]
MFGKTKKIVALALAGMMAVSVLAGCGSSTSSTASVTSRVAYSKADEDKIMGKEDNVSLTVWGPQAALKLLKTQCKTFTSLFPDKKITITCNADSESSAPADVLKDPTKAADVFGFVSDQLVKLYPALLAAKNTDTIKSDNVPMSVTACTYDNKIYAYPETGDNGYVLFYNKSVVSADQAKTWEDVLAACKAKSKSFMMDAGNGYYSCAFTFTGGLTFGNTDDGQTQTLSYDNTKVVNSLTAFGTLIRKYSGTFTSASVT